MAGCAGATGRSVSVMSRSDIYLGSLEPLPTSGPPTGRKLVPAAVNIGSVPVMDAESNPRDVAYACQAASVPRVASHLLVTELE
jgi:hypothetical protein